jgi:hypothetical protein
LVSAASFSQETNTDNVSNNDSQVAKHGYGDNNDSTDSFALPDSTLITQRPGDSETLQRLKTDPELQYKEPPTIAESLWERFLIWLGQFFESLFKAAVTTNWGKVLLYLAGVAVLIIVIMMLLKVNAFKILYSGSGANTFRANVLDENIHEMDFDKLIEEAIGRKDYRGGVRLVFLYALKMLSDKNLINWDQGKTNHDYLDELKTVDLKPGFNDLNYYFEYAWYGNFNITPETFSHVQEIFKTWRNNIK